MTLGAFDWGANNFSMLIGCFPSLAALVLLLRGNRVGISSGRDSDSCCCWLSCTFHSILDLDSDCCWWISCTFYFSPDNSILGEKDNLRRLQGVRTGELGMHFYKENKVAYYDLTIKILLLLNAKIAKSITKLQFSNPKWVSLNNCNKIHEIIGSQSRTALQFRWSGFHPVDSTWVLSLKTRDIHLIWTYIPLPPSICPPAIKGDATFTKDEPTGGSAKARGADPADGGLLQSLPGLNLSFFSHANVHSGGGEK